MKIAACRFAYVALIRIIVHNNLIVSRVKKMKPKTVHVLLVAVLCFTFVLQTMQLRVVYYNKNLEEVQNNDSLHANIFHTPGKSACGLGAMEDSKGRCRRVV